MGDYQRESPQKKSSLQIHWSWTSNLQDCEKVYVCCFGHSVCGICLVTSGNPYTTHDQAKLMTVVPSLIISHPCQISPIGVSKIFQEFAICWGILLPEPETWSLLWMLFEPHVKLLSHLKLQFSFKEFSLIFCLGVFSKILRTCSAVLKSRGAIPGGTHKPEESAEIKVVSSGPEGHF